MGPASDRYQAMASSPPRAPACLAETAAASMPTASGTTRTPANLTSLSPCMFLNPFVRRPLPWQRNRLKLRHRGWSRALGRGFVHVGGEPIVDPVLQVLEFHGAIVRHSSRANEPARTCEGSPGAVPLPLPVRVWCRFHQGTHNTVQAIVAARRNIFANRLHGPAT